MIRLRAILILPWLLAAIAVVLTAAPASAVLIPNPTVTSASEVTETTATLNGRVDPVSKEEVTSCQFEYVTEAAFKASGYSVAQIAQCQPPVPYAVAENVSAAISGLAPSTAYRFRLHAADAKANTISPERTFTTPGPPSIASESSTVQPSGQGWSATLSALIDPFGSDTACQLQYVDEASFDISEYANATTLPCTPADLGSGFAEQSATATLGGLAINTTYHYRFLAANQREQTTVGDDQTFATFGIGSFAFQALDPESHPYTQAGGHPYELVTTFALNNRTKGIGSSTAAQGDLKDVETALPPGLIGDPTAVPKCTRHQLNEFECSGESQVGFVKVLLSNGQSAENGLYNLVSPSGMPAEFGVRLNTFLNVYIDAKVRTGADYGVTALSLNNPINSAVAEAIVSLWGVPSDSRHDAQRRCPGGRGTEVFGCLSTAPAVAFLTDPTSCSGPLTAGLAVDSWQQLGQFVHASAQMPPITGCNQLDFSPTLEARPTTNLGDSPSGLHVDLKVPQNNAACHLGPPVTCGTAEANLKDTKILLPPGLNVNPAAASGLDACSSSQVGLTSAPGVTPIAFTSDPPNCPDAAKIGTVEVDTPLLREEDQNHHPTAERPLPGAVYVAKPHDNPFDSLLAIYIVVNDPESGVVVKLAGQVEPDPQTGQLTTTVAESPQLPFEDFKLDFFKGARAALRTPPTCGTYETTSVLTPWSAPESGPPATPSDSYAISSAPGGGACPHAAAEEPHAPAFEAGTEAPRAGAYSPFVLHLARADGSQELKGLNVALPPGLVGKLAGVAECSDAQLAAAAQHSGAAEQHSPSCPLASEVGTVNVGAGAGPAPYYVQGHAYLAGPYKGAPLSLAIVTPAVAGPFDLGTVLVRTALYVNPETAQITAKSDPIPTILQGIPLDVRSIALNMSRNQFTLNPTSCEKKSITGEALSALGQSAALSNPFQVGGCKNLGFHPNLKLSLKGATKRSKHPALTATLTYPKGAYANIASASVALPHSEFLEQAHIKTVCTRVQFAEGNTPGEKCPAGSIYGRAKAITPLLDKPLEGPVYLRSSSHPLPDLVAALNGQIQVVLDGTIDSVNGGIRNRFEVVPDAPVSKFVLEMQGGKKGLLVNSTNLCARKNHAISEFTGQNGKLYDTKPVLSAKCGGKAKKRHRG